MNPDQQTERQLEDWLEDEARAMPSHVLEAALEAVARTTQVGRNRFAPWLNQRFLAVAMAAVVLVLAVIAAPITLEYLRGLFGPQPGMGPDASAGEPLPSCSEPPDGLTGWWPGDGNHDDIVGGRDAILGGGATFGRGLVRGAFVLDGDGDFAEVPDDSALDVGAGDFTVDLWARFDDTAGEQILVEKWVQMFDAPSIGWTFTKLANNALGFYSQDGSGEGNGISSRPINIRLGTWLHLAARKSGSTVDILMNGTVIASNTDPHGAVNLDSASSLKFGHRGTVSDTPGSQQSDERGFFLSGQIDEVELTVGRALSDRQIADIYLAGAAGKCKDLE